MELVIPNMKVRRGTPGLQKFITEKIDMFLRVNLRNIAAAATPQVEDEDRGEDDDDRIEEIVDDMMGENRQIQLPFLMSTFKPPEPGVWTM